MSLFRFVKKKSKRKSYRFFQKFSESEFESLAESWESKIERSKQGDQRWGIFYAEK